MGAATVRPGRQADVELARQLADARGRLGLAGLLRRYWSAQAEVAPELAERFVDNDLVAAERASEVAAQIERETGRSPAGGLVLEVGCGTAALGAVLAHQAGLVVVSDVSLAWLTIARHRVEQEGLANVRLVACSADRLPFRDGAFDLVVAGDVIEHVPDATAMARSCYGALKPGGSMWLATPNRLSPTPEPHVRLWGVGYLPRRLAAAYVRRARNTSYDGINTLSYPGLARVLGKTGGDVRIVAPPIVDANRARYGRAGRVAIAAYNLVCRAPLVSSAVVWVAPLFHAVVGKDSTSM